MKLKRLPSMREKRHYITFRLHSGNPVMYGEMKGAVMNSILNWMGEEGFSSARCRVIRNLWDHRRQIGWIECSPRAVNDIKMSLALVHQIGDERVIIQVIRVSGTIKSGKSKMK
jgi:RNase P/RNase MRP subunit POP5